MRAIAIIVISILVGAYALLQATDSLTHSLKQHNAALATIVDGARQ